MHGETDWCTTVLLPWLTLLSTVVMTIVTAALARYAYVTIEGGKKNRSKDTIASMLENLYSPLYEILRRKDVRPERLLSEEQLMRVREVLERFGHYMDPVEQARLTNVLSNPDSVDQAF